MTPNDRRLWIDLAAARYLHAVEREDFDTQAELWTLAATDSELEAAFHEIHAGLIEEPVTTTAAAVEQMAEKHLTSGEVVRLAAGPVTMADVADELFRHPPGGLTPDGWRLNDDLRSSAEPLPQDLGLSKLTAWAEAKFGAAPREYWKAFRQAALKLELRRTAETEYQLAARKAPKAEGPK